MKKIINLSLLILITFLSTGCSKQTNQQNKINMDLKPNQSLPLLNSGIYKNDKYGFEFKKPNNWEVDKKRADVNTVVFYNKNSAATESREAISFKPNNKKQPLDQIAGELIKERGYTEQQVKKDYEIKIGGEKTTEIKTGEFGITIYMLIHKETIFIIETQNLFSDDVLKTVKFTN